MGIITLLIELFRNLNIVLPKLFDLIAFIQEYYVAKYKRESDAAQASIDAQVLATQTQAHKEQANLKAFMLGVDTLKKDKYDDILKWIINHQEELILKDLSAIDTDLVNNILFSSSNSSEFKALSIVKALYDK